MSRTSAKEFVEEMGEELLMDGRERQDFHHDSKNRYRILLELLPPEAKRILDVGAGKGLLTFLLREWTGGEVQALDLYPCRREWRRGEWVEVRKCNVEEDEFPFPEESFDCVVCSEVLEHLLYSPFHMLKEIHRVLREEGTLILTTPNAVKLVTRLRIFLGRELSHYRGFYASGPTDRHNKEYTLSEVRELLVEQGFKVEKLFCRNVSSLTGPAVKDRYPSPSLRLKRMVVLSLGSLWPSFREIIFARARKTKD